MKRFLNYLLATLFITLVLISVTSCSYSSYIYVYYEPIYIPFDEVRNQVQSGTPQPVTNPGKIYSTDELLIIAEKDNGIHIFDNRSPDNPVAVVFLPIPGNVDMAVYGTYLYVDTYIDLVTIDIGNILTDPDSAVEIDRLQDVFPQNPWALLPESDQWYPIENIDYSKGVITGLIRREETRQCEWGFPYNVMAASDSSSGSGQGGSMARFTIVDQYLYTVNRTDLHLFSLSNPASPALWSSLPVGWEIETVYPTDGYLFIGSQSGMFVYDISSDPANPQFLTEFMHVRSYDPVVAKGNRAYITLRESPSFGGENLLLSVNIDSIYNPQLISQYSMHEPYGLGISGDTLFVCDGRAGLKIFNRETDDSLTTIVHLPGMESYDVIIKDTTIIVTGPYGITQYDWSNLPNLTLLSSIPVIL